MLQQPLTQTVSTDEFFRRLNGVVEDDRKLTWRDVAMMAAQITLVVAICWGLHIAFA